MRIQNENEILDIKVRQQIIEEMKSPENQERKREAYRRYLVYKDKTKDFVIEQLLNQFDGDTVKEMSYCISNISIVRKIIDKLARVYSNGVDRELEGSEQEEENLELLSKKLKFDTEIKKTNKFLKLQKNVAFYVKPCPIQNIDGSKNYTIKLEPLNPYLYDVVEDYNDRTRPMVYVLSDFKYDAASNNAPVGDFAFAGRSLKEPLSISNSNKKDDKIADDPADQETGEIVWWSDAYHFTTNTKGEIISQEVINPIGEKPLINFAIDQDGSFWAQGGNDLVDGGIFINSIMTHNQHVGISQGYGQFWMKGKNLPRNIKVGANKMILMEYDSTAGESAPDLGFATASPQLDSLRSLVEQYIALLLTTNNLSTSSVSASLNGSSASPSGIAMIIDKSESMEDVKDQRQIFIDNEPQIWRVINKWLIIFRELLIDDLKPLILPEGFEQNMSLNFLEAPMIMSESEKLQNLKIRKELGIDTMLDLIFKDNPQYSMQQAEEKLKSLLEEKIKNTMKSNDQEMVDQESKDESNGSEEGSSDEQQDSLDD